MTYKNLKICIVGGGTLGWWCAAHLEKNHPDYDITLIESEEIPTIGVGESTLPQIATFLSDLGLVEEEWMPKCHAVKKLGNMKRGWTHLSDQPTTFWSNENKEFDSWVKLYLEGNKTRDDFDLDLNKDKSLYAYHLDANLAGKVAKDICVRTNHIIATLDTLPEGYDLYIDCTGLHRKFVNDRTLMPFEHHLVDRALVCPFEIPNGHQTGYTQTIARDSGWQFIVDTSQRIGSGYIYSSQYETEQSALEKFKKYTEDFVPYNNKTPKLLKWKPEVLKNPWSGNVVAIGLSGGWLDPLEANGLFIGQYGITLLSKCLTRGSDPTAYNRAMGKVWRDNSKFILHHYMLSPRVDTPFWKYYSQFNDEAAKSLWKNYQEMGHRYVNLYPDSIWASLAVLYDEFEHYKEKDK